MRKRKKGRKLHREKDQRKAFLKSLSRALFSNEKIKTTEARAKEMRHLVERSITLAKKKDLSAIRQLLETFDKKTVKKITDEIAPRYLERKGGYTRIIKLGPRASDGAKMVIIELIK